MEIFFINALLGGVGFAVAAGPIGCFILWRRMSYFGDSLAHSILLGLGIGYLLEINLTIALLVFAAIFALFLVFTGKKYSSDTFLGILSHGFLATGLILASLIDDLRIDLTSYLFGDILAIDNQSILVIFCLSITTLIWLYYKWRELLLLTINEDLALVYKVNCRNINLQFTLLLSLLIAIATKIIGVLLVSAMLIIPAATARVISNTPIQMLISSLIIAVISVVSGLFASLFFDLPTGPAIVEASLIILIIFNCFLKFSKSR
jgi:zinc transport system permease protein